MMKKFPFWNNLALFKINFLEFVLIKLGFFLEGAVPPETTASKADGTETGKPNEKSTDNDAAEEAASRKRPLMTKAAVCR